ncbi:MAG: hypothetical protein IJY28_10010 [Clostridia bacterium]|nr:hypothetical protein [Clostridia bacterium]
MRYSYRSGGYGYGYGGRKKKKGKAVLTVVALLLIVAAIATAAGLQGKLPFLNGDTDPADSDMPGVSSGPQDEGLPGNLTYIPRPLPETRPVGTLSDITAGTYAVIDRLSGAVVMEKNGNTVIYPGGTTMIMTAAIALEKASVSDMLQGTPFAVNLLGTGSIRLGLTKEEKISMENGLAAMLLGSCADVANVIADNHNYLNFVNTMTARSAGLGCTNTRFINPSGITSTTHFTTVTDLARMEAYAQRNADYRRITAMESAVMDATNVHTVNGWKVVQDNDLISGLRVLFANSGTVASIDNTMTGIDRNGYTMVCSYTTAGGVRLTAVMGGVPYDNGKGAEVCLQQMAALVQVGAKAADQSAGIRLAEANTALTAAQTAGVSRALPEGSKLVVKQDVRLITGERMLNNGTTGLFGTAYTVSAVYYEGLQAALDGYTPGKSVEVGRLTVCGANGAAVAEGIPLYLE